VFFLLTCPLMDDPYYMLSEADWVASMAEEYSYLVLNTPFSHVMGDVGSLVSL